MFRGKRQDRNARKAAEAQRDADQAARIAALANRPDTVCPFLGMAAARADFSNTPHEDHRCFAFGDAAPLSNEQQERVCLQRGYGNCPRYLRGLLVIPTEEMEAIRRRKAFPTDMVQDTPKASPPVPMGLVGDTPTPIAPPEAVVPDPVVPQPAVPAPAAPEPVAEAPPPVAQPDPEPEPEADREPEPVAAAVALEMPPPIRIAVRPRQPEPASSEAQPVAHRRSRRWRTATLVMASLVLILAMASVTGLFALSQIEPAPVVVPTATQDVAPTRSAEPTPSARPTPTPRPTRSARPTRSPRPTATATPRVTLRPTSTARPAPGTWTYIIRDYDSISSIAQRYGTTTETVLDLNPRYRDNPNLVVEGDPVIVPCTAIAQAEGRCD